MWCCACPAEAKGLAAALDRKTGKTVWATPGIADRAAYGSPLVAEYRGVRMMITMTEEGVVAVDVKDGKLLWTHPFRRPNVSQNANIPVFRDGYLFVACGHFTGGSLLKINDDLRGVTEVWHMRDFDNCHGGLILLGERLYGCGCRLGGKGFYCVDFLSGKTLATDRTLGKVALSYADGMLYALNHERPFYLLEVKPDGFEIVSQFTSAQEGPWSLHQPPGHLRRPAVRPVRRVFVLLGYSGEQANSALEWANCRRFLCRFTFAGDERARAGERKKETKKDRQRWSKQDERKQRQRPHPK